MKLPGYEIPRSSFLSLEKDTSKIVDFILKNERLKKLLYYTTPDCLSQPDLTEEETLSLFGKQIKLVPKILIDNSVLTYVNINFDNFSPNATNTEFRDNMIEFDIICHFDQWQLPNFALRPYKIAAELDTMFDNQKFSGIGTLHFIGGSQILMNDEYAGFCLMYRAIHDGDDEKKALTEEEQISLEENFNKIFNNL